MPFFPNKFFLRIIFIALFCVIFYDLPAQIKNLVIDPSFESNPNPPNRTWIPWMKTGEVFAPGWHTPTPASPDYFNSEVSTCEGQTIVLARTGQGRCGLVFGRESYSGGDDNYREYAQGSFTEPLITGKTYQVKFYIALDNSCIRTVKDIGAFISTDSVRAAYPSSYWPFTLFLDPKVDMAKIKSVCSPWGMAPCDLLINYMAAPQVIYDKYIFASDGWVEIAGLYTAKGGERYITIGNFSRSKYAYISSLGKKGGDMTRYSPHICNSAYFYLDDVSVSLYDSTKKTNAFEDKGDHYLFLLDVSGSMSASGNLDLMKKEIRRFADSLGRDNNIGLMAFSDRCKMILPFTMSKDTSRIDSLIGKLRAGGGTDGDLAIREACEVLNNFPSQHPFHIIMATDGIFEMSTETMNKADSLFKEKKTTFCALQFGKKRNSSLEKIAKTIPGSSYMMARKKNISAHLDKQRAEQKQNEPEIKDLKTVRYTDTVKLTGDQKKKNSDKGWWRQQ